MFITENQNIGDSVLFLMAARTSLANIVESQKTPNKKNLVSFIYNEASDYQIMHLLLKGSLPEEKYNPVAEAELFSSFKESMLINKAFVTEMVGESIFNNILYEVDSLYMVTSTAGPILEFAANSSREIALACFISEAPSRLDFARAMAKSSQKAQPKEGPSSLDFKQAMDTPTKLSAMQKMHQASSDKAGVGQVDSSLKAAADLAKKKQMHKVSSDTSGATLATLKHKAGEYGDKFSQFAQSPAGHATAGAAAAALAIYAGYKIFKRFFSQAAKACAGQKGEAKTACMNKYKKQAIMKQASTIQSNAGTCAKSKDPAKCKAAIAAKVASLKAKAAKIPA